MNYNFQHRNRVILKRGLTIDDSGQIVWELLLGTAIGWILICILILLGRRLSSGIIYFSAIFSYIVLLILGIRGWMLPGSGDGINFYLYPDWKILLNSHVWIDAGSKKNKLLY